MPWREALRRLEAEGWVEIVRNVGATVRTFDTDVWQRTLRLLARLEGYATALAAPVLTEADLAQARELNQAMALALDDIDPARFGSLNREFHRLLCSRCGDERLVDMVDTEWSRLELVRRTAFWYAPGRARVAVAEHDGLLDLIEGSASSEMIETAAKRHELNTVEAVTKYEEDVRRQEREDHGRAPRP